MTHLEPDDPALLNLADAINDGTPVDWAKARRGAPRLGPAVEKLKSLEAIAAAYQASSGPRADAGASITADFAGPGTEPPNPEAVQFTWGSLQVVEALGAGRYGEVYRAFDPRVARYVALKLWRPPADSRPAEAERSARALLDEARRMARVRHPNVLVVHGADIHDGVAGLWCDLLSGETLEAGVQHGRRLSATEAAFIGIELCRGLAALHAAGFVHGDLKAANVMRDDGGAIVLLDFGSSRSSQVGAAGQRAATISGTPLAMSPELLRGEAAGPEADLYALGVLVYRLVSGKHPIETQDLAELLARHASGQRTLLRERRPDLPAPFVQVVERALSAEPAARFTSAGEMETALWEALRESNSPAGSSRSDGAWRAGWGQGAADARRVAVMALFVAVVALAFFVLRGGLHGTGFGPTAGPDFEVEAALYRTDSGGISRLQDGSRVRPGDRLHLDVVGSVPLYTYVIDEDDRGALYVLFPVPGLEPANPLPVGGPHRLPGHLGDVAQDWQVTSAGGRETVLIVTSRGPLPLLEARLSALPAAQPGQTPVYASLDPVALSELRGIAGLAATDTLVVVRPGSRLKDLAASLNEMKARRPGGLWVRTIELDNP